MDISQTNVLNVQAARDNKDEKHLCPLQLDVIDRAIRLWSNPGDVVLSPFMGIGSEGVMALRVAANSSGQS
jgi:DNA modification methylase